MLQARDVSNKGVIRVSIITSRNYIRLSALLQLSSFIAASHDFLSGDNSLCRSITCAACHHCTMLHPAAHSQTELCTMTTTRSIFGRNDKNLPIASVLTTTLMTQPAAPTDRYASKLHHTIRCLILSHGVRSVLALFRRKPSSSKMVTGRRYNQLKPGMSLACNI